MNNASPYGHVILLKRIMDSISLYSNFILNIINHNSINIFLQNYNTLIMIFNTLLSNKIYPLPQILLLNLISVLMSYSKIINQYLINNNCIII